MVAEAHLSAVERSDRAKTASASAEQVLAEVAGERVNKDRREEQADVWSKYAKEQQCEWDESVSVRPDAILDAVCGSTIRRAAVFAGLRDCCSKSQ